MMHFNMIVKEEFIQLESDIKKIINRSTQNSEIQILKSENGEGLYVVFGKLEIRSSIRIYPTTSADYFSYAIGNKQFKLTYEQIIERFQIDFKDELWDAFQKGSLYKLITKMNKGYQEEVKNLDSHEKSFNKLKVNSQNRRKVFLEFIANLKNVSDLYPEDFLDED